MEVITKTKLEKLKENIDDIFESLDIKSKKETLGSLELEANSPDFWKDQMNAKGKMEKIESLRNEIDVSIKLQEDIQAIIELFDQTPTESIDSLKTDIEDLEKRVSEFEIFKFLSGKYDKGGAILSIHSGQGGTEANDWAEMLMRMYMRYCERNGWKSEVLDMVSGGEVGISSVTIEIQGEYAFGKLKKENGTHRLVRLSPFNAQNLRQTSFAGVEIIPIIDEVDSDIEIRDEDIELKAVKASGAGGQHVNKTSSAVQIRHIPTGITVGSSERRDQFQNKKAALNILRAKLWQIEEDKRDKEISDIKGEHKIAGWGNQVRNYVLHPYKLVKDLRTGVELSNPETVLDGDLNSLIDAQIRIG